MSMETVTLTGFAEWMSTKAAEQEGLGEEETGVGA